MLTVGGLGSPAGGGSCWLVLFSSGGRDTLKRRSWGRGVSFSSEETNYVVDSSETPHLEDSFEALEISPEQPEFLSWIPLLDFAPPPSCTSQSVYFPFTKCTNVYQNQPGEGRRFVLYCANKRCKLEITGRFQNTHTQTNPRALHWDITFLNTWKSTRSISRIEIEVWGARAMERSFMGACLSNGRRSLHRKANENEAFCQRTLSSKRIRISGFDLSLGVFGT